MDAPEPRIKLLLADDAPSIHVTLSAVLRLPPAANVELFSAYSLHDAGNLAMDLHPDVMLLDLQFGRTDPSDEDHPLIDRTIEAIKILRPVVPIVIFTGHSGAKLWARCIDELALNFLTKEVYLQPSARPFLMHSLTNAIFLHAALKRYAVL